MHASAYSVEDYHSYDSYAMGASTMPVYYWQPQDMAACQQASWQPTPWQPKQGNFMINLDGFSSDDDSDAETNVHAIIAARAAKVAGANKQQDKVSEEGSPNFAVGGDTLTSSLNRSAAQRDVLKLAWVTLDSGALGSAPEQLSLPPWQQLQGDSGTDNEQGALSVKAGGKSEVLMLNMYSSASTASSSHAADSSSGSDSESTNSRTPTVAAADNMKAVAEHSAQPPVAQAQKEPSSPPRSQGAILAPDSPVTSSAADSEKEATPSHSNEGAAGLKSSWLSAQRQRRSSMEELFQRRIKSLLNKLTVEKFEDIRKQILTIGFSKVAHLELFIREIFEKATSQHHFINMYADLCVDMHTHMLAHPLEEDPKGVQFKKLLLTQCQRAFETNLQPPSALSSLQGEDRLEAEVRYKMAMLGNIRLVGALLTRKMLAGKVLIPIAEELLAGGSSEALESLAALLTVVGPGFDTAEWPFHVALRSVFEKVRVLSQSPKVERRIQCLLKDVLDLRKNGWKDQKPQKLEGPKKLSASKDSSPKQESKDASAGLTATPAEPASTTAGKKPVVGTSRLAAFIAGTSSSEMKATQSRKVSTPVKKEQPKTFDLTAFRLEVSQTLAELAVSHDVKDAVERIAAVKCPREHQASEVARLLEEAVQASSADARGRGMEVVTGLITSGGWTPEALRAGLATFLTDVCPDLYIDMPNLPQVLSKELHPLLAPLSAKGVLSASEHDAVLSAISE